MAVVKSVRRVAHAAGKRLDSEDRQLLGVAFVWLASGATLIVAGALAVGLAVRLFGIAAG